MDKNPSSARRAALRGLNGVFQKGRAAKDVIDESLRFRACPERDRGLFTELVYGVVRMRGTLDWLAQTYSGRPLSAIDAGILNVLRLGIYQLLFLRAVPPYAAVSESVDLARTVAPRAAPFVNAVLRKIPADHGEIPFPLLEEDPEGYLSVVFSHPRWMVSRWLGAFGPGETMEICRADNLPPPFTVRVNSLKTNRASLAGLLRKGGVECEEGKVHPLALVLKSPGPLRDVDAFRNGLFQVQDETAMAASDCLSPRKGELVLDLCCGVGGKSTHLAQIMEAGGEVLALDRSEGRLRSLRENLVRLGIRSVKPIRAEVSEASAFLGGRKADRVLLDAPCSNTGVLRRRVEARWRLRPHDLPRLRGVQLGLLRSSADLLRDGGSLLYCTCSLEGEENGEAVRNFLEERPAFRLVREELKEPVPGGPDGGYMALLEKGV